MEEIIKKLTELSKTIATMESCTGGAVANSITNIEGASLVFKFGAVTYSNEYKIKMGVDSNIIDKYTVYSIETAMEMSKNIAEFSNADYGIGITGKINREDQNNMFGDNSNHSVFDSAVCYSFFHFICDVDHIKFMFCHNFVFIQFYHVNPPVLKSELHFLQESF